MSLHQVPHETNVIVRGRLLEIAQMCPVHRTLRSEVYIPAPDIVEDVPSSDDFLRR